MGVLSSIDAPSLELLVDSWLGYRMTQAHVQEHGYTSTTPNRQTLSQFFQARKTLFQESMKLLTQFGFTPVARASLAGALVGNKTVDDDDPLAAILRKRAEWGSG